MFIYRAYTSCFTRYQVRFVRTKALSNAVNSFLGDINRKTDEVVEHDFTELKKHGFSEVNVDAGLDEWFMHYLSMTNPGFQKSKKNLTKLQQQERPDMTVIVEYLLRESENELRRLQSMSPEAVEESFTRHKDKELVVETKNDNNLETKVFKEIINEGAKKHFRPLANTENLFQLLEKISAYKDIDKESIISLEQMVHVFELAKLIPDKESRLKGQYLAGQLIYSLKRVRLDPGNESFYIDSLLFYGKYKTAISLFESYKDRVRERWWYEVGMMTYLRSNKTLKFSYLYEKTKEIFSDGYIRPKVVKVGIQVLLRNRDVSMANSLVKDFISTQKKLGWANEITKEHTKTLNFESSEDANEFLNEFQSPSKKDFISIISYYFLHGCNNEAWKLLAYFHSKTGLDRETFHFLCQRLRLQWLKSFELFGDEFKPHFPANTKADMQQLENWFKELLKDPYYFRVQTDFPYLLFDDLYQLLQSRRLNSVLDNFTAEFWSVNMNETDIVTKSKKYQGLLKILLYGEREKAALELLTKLENEREEFLDKGRSSSVFSPVNAYHYATFISYYAINGSKSSKKKIEAILSRAKQNNVPFNSALIDVSLKYLMKTKKYSDCSLLLGTILDQDGSKINVSNDFSEEILLSPALYKTIWTFYGDYYRLSNRYTDPCSKLYESGAQSPLDVFLKQQVRAPVTHSMIDIFKRMVQVDKIPIDESIQRPLVRAFVANGEWCNLLAVLAYMSREKVEISCAAHSYIMKGLNMIFPRGKGKQAHSTEVEDTSDSGESSRIEKEPVNVNESSKYTQKKSKEDELMALILDYLLMKHYSLTVIEEHLKILGGDLESIREFLPSNVVIL